MNKEIVIAIILGLTVGIVAAISIWAAKEGTLKLSLSLPKLSQVEKKEPTITPTAAEQKPQENFFLDITSPENETIVTNNEIELTGKTNPEVSIIVSQEANDTVLSSKKDGSFSTKITLSPGPNTIIIIAIDQGTNTAQVARTIVFQEQK